jgi:hypothetical protein
MPPWAVNLPQLGAVDTGQIRPEDLLQSETTAPGGSTPAPASTDASATDTSTPATTAGDATEVPTTTGG